MSVKYHVNPETGKAGICLAKKGNCRFGDIPHHKNHKDAEQWYEQQQPDSSTFKKLSKTSNKDVSKMDELLEGEESVGNEGDNEKLSVKPYVFPDRAETRTFESKSGTVTLMVSDKLTTASTPHELEAWLTLENGENVAFLRVLVRSEEYNPEIGTHLSMCDIETRVGYRKKGYARELRESLEKETGLLIYSSGSYTPEGWEAFKKHSRVAPNDPYANEFNKPTFNSMGFVASWKNRIPQNVSQRIGYSDEQREAMWELNEQGVFRKFRSEEIMWAED